MRDITYPFEPRSTSRLQPGQFWAIPLGLGQFGCGRVVQLIECDGKRDARRFLAAVSSWVGEREPSSELIAGHALVAEGMLHIKSIQEAGGTVLGHRSLDLDGLSASLHLDQAGGSTCLLLEGARPIRRASASEIETYSVLPTWGYRVPTIHARKLLEGGAV